MHIFLGLGIRSSVFRANNSFFVSKRATWVIRSWVYIFWANRSQKSKSLTLLFFKERFTLLKRATRGNRSQSLFKMSDFEQKSEFPTLYFVYVFRCFSPFYAQEQIGPTSLLRHYFLKSNCSYSLSSLFTKERACSNRSRWYLQKSDRERFAHFTL